MKHNYLKFALVLALTTLFFSTLFAKRAGAEFGVDQYSAVSFDANGLAHVVSKFTWQNFSNQSLDHFSLEIPGKNSQVFNAIQELVEIPQVCLKWGDSCREEDESGICTKYERACDLWQENSGGQRSYRYSSLEQDIERKENSILYSFALQEPVEPNKQASVIVAYRTGDYVEKKLGRYQFNFPTPQLSYRTAYARLVFSVEDPLFLAKAAPNEPFYKKVIDIFEPLTVFRAESPLLERISLRLSNLEGLVFEEYALEANTSFQARGKYAPSQFMLYWPIILLAILIVILASGFLVYLILSLEKNKKKRKKLEKFFTRDSFQLPSIALLNAGALFLIYSLAQKFSQTDFARANPDSPLTDLISFAFLIFILVGLFAPPLFIWKYKQAKSAILVFVMMLIIVIIISFSSSIILL